VIVLATHDGDGRSGKGLSTGHAWQGEWNDSQGDRQMPMMGGVRAGWNGGRDAPILPWVLFAVSTGTVVGLLIAWSPWRTARANAIAGPDGGDEGSTQVLQATATEQSEIPAGSQTDVEALKTEEVTEAPTTEVVTEAPTTDDARETPAES
jgi:hypothetical protein